MKLKKSSKAIIQTFKSNGFVLSEPDVLLDSEYIIERSGEKFRSSMLTFENEDGKITPMDVKMGDIVLFGKWSGTEVKIDGKEYSIMKESDIMGISKSKK